MKEDDVGLMAEFIGAIIGCMILGSVVIWIVEKFSDDDLEPGPRAVKMTIIAYIAVAVISIFGYSQNGQIAWTAPLFYLPGAFALFLITRRRYRKAWVEHSGDEEIFS